MKQQIVICMPLKNAEKTLQKAIQSVLDQEDTNREIILLIGNDGSTDKSIKIVQTYLPNPNIILVNVAFGKVHSNRNFLNNYAKQTFPNCALIGRLDADDFIVDKNTLYKIEKRFDEHNFDVLLCGNQQRRKGQLLEWENKPSKDLLIDDFLLQRLSEMTRGNPKAELPSCNTFIKPTVGIEYPDKESAEDHWFTVLLLLQKQHLHIYIDDNLLYCAYSLDGLATKNNQMHDIYWNSRMELYQFYKTKLGLK